MGLRQADVASWDSKRVESEMRDRLDELKAVKAAHGGTFEGVTPQEAGTIRRVQGELEMLGERLDESRELEGGDERFARYDEFVGRVDDYFNTPGERPPHGRIPGGPGIGRGSLPGPAGWRQGTWADAFMHKLGAAVTPSGTINVPSLRDGIVPLTERPRRLLEVMPFDRVGMTDRFAYIRETVRTLAAAPVASGGTKPTSVISVVKTEDRARVIAHLGEPIDRFILSDAALLRGYLEGSFRDGVFLALEQQIVTGDGLVENLTGITNTSGIQVIAFDLGGLIRTARKMGTALENVDLPDVSAFYLLNPAQWEAIELATAAGSGEFLLENAPVNISARRLWGRPVIVSRACPTTHFFLVDRASVAVFERESVMIDWATESSTLFETNQVRLRAEGRYGFAVMRPTGIVKAPTA